MRHLLAYQQSVDAATATAITVVNDGIVSRPGADRFRVPAEMNFVHWAFASGVNLTRAYIETPTLQTRRQRPEIIPHERGAAVITAAEFPLWIPPLAIELAPTEDMQVFVTEDAAGASQVDVIVCIGSPETPDLPSADIRVVRAVGTTTLVARTWTNCPLTLDQGLEPGLYELIGFLAIGATAIAARANITGQPYRPGLIALSGAEGVAREYAPFVFDRLQDYPMGQFTHQEFPSFEFYATAADTAQTVIAKLAKIG